MLFRSAARFDGHLYWQDHVLEEDSFVVFRKREENPAALSRGGVRASLAGR